MSCASRTERRSSVPRRCRLLFPLKRSRTVCTPPYSLGKAIENFRCLEALVGFASLPDFSATTPLLDPSAKYGQDAQIHGIRRTFRIKSSWLELRSIHK